MFILEAIYNLGFLFSLEVVKTVKIFLAFVESEASSLNPALDRR
jgi:hypothetical protein